MMLKHEKQVSLSKGNFCNAGYNSLKRADLICVFSCYCFAWKRLTCFIRYCIVLQHYNTSLHCSFL